MLASFLVLTSLTKQRKITVLSFYHESSSARFRLKFHHSVGLGEIIPSGKNKNSKYVCNGSQTQASLLLKQCNKTAACRFKFIICIIVSLMTALNNYSYCNESMSSVPRGSGSYLDGISVP